MKDKDLKPIIASIIHAMADLHDLLGHYLALEVDWRVDMDWKDDLNGAPSQCYKHVSYAGHKFVLYLRWRHADPWQATIIERPVEYEDDDDGVWHDLPVQDFGKEQLGEVKASAEHHARLWLITKWWDERETKQQAI